MTKQKILIDTDPGQDIDDLLAIWFALRRPELDIQAITTVTYPTAQRARLVRRLLRHLGRDDIPVAPGMEHPLRTLAPAEVERLHQLEWSMNHACFAEPADPRDEADQPDAIQLIIDTVERHPGEIILACIAPLTNIACALRRQPTIAGKIKHIALMGGETALNRAEHNIAFDDTAAEIVLTSGVPIAMGTWDVTRRCVLTDQDCARFRSLGTALGSAMAEAIGAWHQIQNWKPGPVMYDLFPLIWAFDRTWYETRPMPVRVETRGAFTRGMTVVGGDGPTMDVTTGMREGLREFYLSTIFE